MKLRVKKAQAEDIYRDIIRVPEQYRKDTNSNLIKEGSVCKVIVRSWVVYAILRGISESNYPEVQIDERLRNKLEVNVDDEIDFVFKISGLWGQFMWAWNASDPAYRISARMCLLSIILGILALILGILALGLSIF